MFKLAQDYDTECYIDVAFEGDYKEALEALEAIVQEISSGILPEYSQVGNKIHITLCDYYHTGELIEFLNAFDEAWKTHFQVETVA